MGAWGGLVIRSRVRVLAGEPPGTQSLAPLARPSLPFPCPQTETKVEPYEVYDPVPLIVGSSVGGLVLLALITAALYKVPPGALCLPLPPLPASFRGLTAAAQPAV